MKAILVIDMPEKCEDCLLYNNECCCADIQWHLTGELGYREVWHPEKRQEWCPLKPMPKERKGGGSKDTAIAYGWNLLLEKIGGIEDENDH